MQLVWLAAHGFFSLYWVVCIFCRHDLLPIYFSLSRWYFNRIQSAAEVWKFYADKAHLQTWWSASWAIHVKIKCLWWKSYPFVQIRITHMQKDSLEVIAAAKLDQCICKSSSREWTDANLTWIFSNLIYVFITV